MLVFAVGRPDVDPLEMPARFRTDIAYFMCPPGEHGAPKLPQGEYWVRLEDAEVWLEEGVMPVVSPLDSTKSTEFELSEDQETWLRWMVTHRVQHVRVQ